VQIFRSLAEVPANFGPSVVAIGKFNGVHLGHVEMIALAKSEAQKLKARTVVVTFDRHPAALLNPQSVPADITGPERRLELIAAAGVDAALVLEFTEQLAALSPTEFVSSILVDALHAGVVVVGNDFRFGSHATGDCATLRELGAQFGFDVVELDDVAPGGDRRVSSSWIRELLESGDVATASQLLGRRHAVRGMVVHGEARGRLLGYPTANLASDSTGYLPADGTYAGWLIDEDGTRYPAAISIGTNPTFEGERTRRLEAFVIDHTLDLYDHVVVVEFVEYLRGMYKFDGIDKLIAQMDDDIVQIRGILGLPATE
jgi:riboflavin kinase/FMN adenylyltransferase